MVPRRLHPTNQPAYRLTSLRRNKHTRPKVLLMARSRLPSTRLPPTPLNIRRRPTTPIHRPLRIHMGTSHNIPQVFRRRQANMKECREATKAHHNTVSTGNLGSYQVLQPNRRHMRRMVPMHLQARPMGNSSMLHRRTEAIREHIPRSRLHPASIRLRRHMPTRDQPFHTDLTSMGATNTTRRPEMFGRYHTVPSVTSMGNQTSVLSHTMDSSL